MTNEENENNLQKFTAEEALKKLNDEEAARQEAYDKKYVNKSIGTDPAEFTFTGEIEFGKVAFKQKDGTEKISDVWKFRIAEDREFSTSNFQLSREILTALKDNKHRISLAHRSVKGKDGNYHDSIVMIKAE